MFARTAALFVALFCLRVPRPRPIKGRAIAPFNLNPTYRMKAPTHTQITLVSFLAPTDTLGARIKMEDGTTGKIRVIPYNYSFNSPEKGALAWFAEHGVHPVGRASFGRNIENAILIHAPEDSSALFKLFVRP